MRAADSRTLETDDTHASEVGPIALDDDVEHLALLRVWGRAPGLVGWIAATDHKEIGLRFIVTAFGFFVVGGILALLIRFQLMRPESRLIGPDIYNQLFTTHGTTMMFLFAVPVMQGFGLYLVPLMIGTRTVAFPRLINFAYYMYLIAGLLLYGGLLTNTGPDTGWFSYVPLSGPDYGIGKRVDVWSQVVTLSEISAMAVAVAIVVTVLKLRAPGMSLNRIPIFVWAQIIISIMTIFAMPSVTLCSTMLSADRLTKVNTHFFNPAEGGDPLLWQHLFWFFAHPEVYIIFIPASAFVSTIIPAFCRRRSFGYPALVLASASVAIIGFGVWVHHMFATPLPELGQGLFTGSSLVIAIPNGVQMFCWTATFWSGRPYIRMPFVFVLGFFAVFLIGGLTGVMLASVSINQQVHDTFFVVAHLHYVLIGGAVFPLFGAFYFWFPKWTGRLLSDRLGWLNFWLLFIGFNLAFFPMHELGLRGMPRRIYSYREDTGWGPLNFTATVGAVTIGVSVLVFMINVVRSSPPRPDRGDRSMGGGNPRMVGGLAATRVQFPAAADGARPLRPLGKSARYACHNRDFDRRARGPCDPDARRGTVLRYRVAEDSAWPAALALSVGAMLIGLIFHPIAIPIGSAVVFLVLIGWFWPTKGPQPIHNPAPPDDAIPSEADDGRATALAGTDGQAAEDVENPEADQAVLQEVES